MTGARKIVSQRTHSNLPTSKVGSRTKHLWGSLHAREHYETSFINYWALHSKWRTFHVITTHRTHANSSAEYLNLRWIEETRGKVKSCTFKDCHDVRVARRSSNQKHTIKTDEKNKFTRKKKQKQKLVKQKQGQSRFENLQYLCKRSRRFLTTWFY